MRLAVTRRQVDEIAARGFDLPRLAAFYGLQLDILEEPDPTKVIIVAIPLAALGTHAVAGTAGLLCRGGCGVELGVAPESSELLSRGANGPFCSSCVRRASDPAV